MNKNKRAPAHLKTTPTQLKSASSPAQNNESAKPVSKRLDSDSGNTKHTPQRSKQTARMKNPRRIATAMILTAVLVVLALAVFDFGIGGMTLLRCEDGLKAEIKTLASSMLDGDTEAAANSIPALENIMVEVEGALDRPTWQLAARVPMLKQDLASVRDLLAIADYGIDEVLRPLLAKSPELMPETSSETGATLNVLISSVLTYARRMDELLPAAEYCATELQSIPTFRISRIENTYAPIRELCSLVPGFSDLLNEVLMAIPEELESEEFTLKSLLKMDGSFYEELTTLADDDLRKLLTELTNVCTTLSEKDGKVGEKAAGLLPLLNFAPKAIDQLLLPCLDVIWHNPPSELKLEGLSINAQTASAYLELLEELMPALEQLLAEAELLLPEDNETVAALWGSLTEKYDNIEQLYSRGERYIPFLKEFLGNGEDRCYLLAAQNTSEIRALGGFPGDMCLVTIEDGILKVGSFTNPYIMLAGSKTYAGYDTGAFNGLLAFDHDAVANPDFTLVAEYWAKDIELVQGKKIDGVISLTTGIINDLVGLVDSIELSDGSELDSTNTMYFLSLGIYEKYTSAEAYENGLSVQYTDNLFVEIPSLVCDKLFEDFSMERFNDILDIAEKRIDDRVIMLWMADEQEQQTVYDIGAAGDFGNDPLKPMTGVFFSNHNAGKMGWFVDFKAEVGEGTENADGSYTYPMTVSVTNMLTRDIINKNSTWIVGRIGGAMYSSFVLTAPMGGSVSDIKYTINVEHAQEEYFGRDLHVLKFITLNPGATITLTYNVTTAPGVSEPLQLIQTPTLDEFRDVEYTA